MLDGAIVAAYLAAVVGAGWLGARRRKRGVADYVVAGRALTLPFFVATLVPSFYGGVLGIGEFTWQSGLSNWLVMALPYYVFAALYAVLFAGRVRLEPGLTMSDHIERAYDGRLAILAALLVFILSSPADELLMIGALVSRFTGLPLAAAAALGGGLALALVAAGGLRSDVSANVVQFVVMFGGFAVVVPFAWLRVGPPSALAARLPAGHLSLTGGMSPLRIAAWWLIAVWTIVDPVFHQRCAAAESPRAARDGILASVACWAAFDAMTTLAGLYARAALPSLDRPLMAYPALADAVLPAGARGFFFAGLCSSILAGLQGRALQSSISLGKDALGRVLSADDARQKRLALFALLVSGVLGYALALWVPSVVTLWYDIGSAVIPGLLWPFVGVYFPALRAPARWATAASAGGWLLSTGWVVVGQRRGVEPLGIDPMFPGLALSALTWAAGLIAARGARRAQRSAAHA